MNAIRDVYNAHGHKDEIVFKTFAGHTMTLKEPKDYNADWEKWKMETLPMIPNQFSYKPSKDKVSLYEDIKRELVNGHYDYVINACDPGREGQHIFFSFYDSLGLKLPVKRIWHRDLQEAELKRALDNLLEETDPMLKNMTIASKYRAYFDWLIGLNSTRAVSLMANKKINVGRVMTPVLKIVVDRELELRNFIPKDFWEVKADFGSYQGTYFDDKNENETKFFKKEKAEAIVNKLSSTGTVVSVSQKEETKYPPQLHSLQELSNEANRTFGYTMSETLDIVQMLYEKKILSYPRTDSSHITKGIAKDFKKILNAVLSVPELGTEAKRVMNDDSLLKSVANNKKYVDDTKVTDHYAIIPTGVSVALSTLSEKERNIFTLVAKRFLAIFMPPFVAKKTTIITDSNGNLFNTTGSVLIDKGYTALYDYKVKELSLPSVKKGTVYDIQKVELVQGKTKPPQRYNDETLGKSMEKANRFIEDEELSSVLVNGLGTPATRGGIVDKLVNIAMIERKGSGKVKSFFATDFGIQVIQMLEGKDITLPELTATWEQKLSEIEKGTYKPQDFYHEMIEYVNKTISDLKSNLTVANSSHLSSKESLGECPKCHAPVVEGKSYYLCSNYKNTCDFIVGKTIMGASITKTEVKKILSGKESKEYEFTWKSGKKGKAKLKIENGKVSFVFP